MRSPPLVAASVAWGASAGTLSVTRRGLATPDRREIHQLLDRIDVVPLR
jgi:fructose-1-phosphate kinase PfkB-like protein